MDETIAILVKLGWTREQVTVLEAEFPPTDQWDSGHRRPQRMGQDYSREGIKARNQAQEATTTIGRRPERSVRVYPGS